MPRLALNAVIVLVSLLAGCKSEDQAAAERLRKAGKVVVLRDRQGTKHELSTTYRQGKNVVLIFWQPWSALCQEAAPALARGAREHGDELEFYGVVSGPDEYFDEGHYVKMIRYLRFDFPQIRDRDQSLANRFIVFSSPTVLILGKGNKVLYRGQQAPYRWSRFITP